MNINRSRSTTFLVPGHRVSSHREAANKLPSILGGEGESNSVSDSLNLGTYDSQSGFLVSRDEVLESGLTSKPAVSPESKRFIDMLANRSPIGEVRNLGRGGYRVQHTMVSFETPQGDQNVEIYCNLDGDKSVRIHPPSQDPRGFSPADLSNDEVRYFKTAMQARLDNLAMSDSQREKSGKVLSQLSQVLA